MSNNPALTEQSPTAASPLRSVDFRVVEGRGAASGQREFQEIGGTLRAQKPHFERSGLNLQGFFEGTINAQLPIERFEMRQPLYRARNVVWLPGYPGENFDFSNCAVIFEGLSYPALIYYPRPETKSAFASPTSPNMIEVLAPFIANLRYGSSGTLIVSTDQIHLFDRGRSA